MPPNVIVARDDTFQLTVLERSHQLPMLVDFWAPWCGPCRTLTPLLEALAAESEGAWLLAKINTDENPELARRYNIRGIPNVKLFKDGQVVDEFVGAQPRPVIEKFLAKWLPSPIDEEVKTIEAAIQEGNVEEARPSLENLITSNPHHEGARLALARLELAANQPEAALAQLNTIPSGSDHHDTANQLRAQARFALTSPNEGEVAGDPELSKRFQQACQAVKDGEYDKAAELFLEVIDQNRQFQDGAAHQAMLDLFVLLGEADPRTAQYRRRLSWLLFS